MEILLYKISFIIITISGFVITALIFSKKPRSRFNKLYALTSISMMIWAIGRYALLEVESYEAALVWVRILYVGSILVHIFFLHTILVFLGIEGKRKTILIVFYINAAVLLFFNVLDLFIGTNFFVADVAQKLNFQFYEVPNKIYHLHLINYIFIPNYALVELIIALRRFTGVKRQQLIYILISSILGFFGGNSVIPLIYNIPIRPFFVFLVPFHLISMAYAIMKYRLLGMKFIANKAFTWISLAFFAYVFFYGLAGLYYKFFGGIFNTKSYVSGIFVALFFSTSTLYFITYSRIISDWLFYRGFNPHRHIKDIILKLNKTIDVRQFAKMLGKEIKRTLEIKKAAVIVLDEQGSFEIAFSDFPRKGIKDEMNKCNIVNILQREKKAVIYDEIEFINSNGFSEQEIKSIKECMEAKEVFAIMPLIAKDRLAGFVVLGAKNSGATYADEEINFLLSLIGQVGVTLENARLYAQVRDLSDNLQEKVDEQTKDIKEKNKHLQELLNMKSDFLRVVNHQLNTPLSVMRNAYSMIGDNSISQEKVMKFLGEGLQRMDDTIKDFWIAFRYEGQTPKMHPEKTNIEEIVNQQIEEKKHLRAVEERGLKLEVRQPNFSAQGGSLPDGGQGAAGGKVPLVYCDTKNITHVVSNLLDNAVFYTAKGSITVSYELETKDKIKYLKILTHDTGVGIKPEDRQRLFHKFARGSSATNIRPDGSGLGLYIAKRIAESNGGELTLEQTEINKGTTFSFTVPLYTGQASQERSEISRQAERIVTAGSRMEEKEYQPKGQLPKILLIEDESSLVEMYNVYFNRHGYRFFSTKDIGEGLKISKKEKINVIILDIIIPKVMPDGSVYTMAEQGWDFLKQVKKDNDLKNIPIIVFSNLNTTVDRQKAEKLGAVEYIVKSDVGPKDMEKIIKKAVGQGS